MDGNCTRNHNLFGASGRQARELSATELNAVSGASAPSVSEIVVTKDVDCSSANLFRAATVGSK
jgi:type VI protein secretion system component Hcp